MSNPIGRSATMAAETIAGGLELDRIVAREAGPDLAAIEDVKRIYTRVRALQRPRYVHNATDAFVGQ